MKTKKYGYIIVMSLLLVVSCLLLVNYGCGTTTATTTTTTSSTTTTLPAATITLSGALSSGSISSVGIKSFAAVSNYKIIAIDNATGQTYSCSSDAEGNFAVEIPANISYEVSLIDSNANYFGPIVMVGDTASSEVVMGITPTATTSLGVITVDTTDKYAKPTSEPTAIANLDDIAEASNGIPKGAGNTGKTEQPGVTTRESGADIDKDGIPNFFDADKNNDGIRNGIIDTPSTGTSVYSNTVEAVFYSSNIWADHGTTDEAYNLIAMRLHVMPVSGKIDEIASVEVVSVPATIADDATVRWADSLGSPEGYPDEGSLWKDSGYHLYKTTDLPTDQHYIISICPRAAMNVGDTFIIRATYTGGGYQDFFITTSYFLTDWARILTYNGTTLVTAEGQKTTSEAAVFTTSTLEVVFSKPLDEDGNVLEGLTYSIICATVEAGGSGTLPVPANVGDHEYRAAQYPDAFTDGADFYTVQLDELVTFESAAYYYITPVAESADGQRNGEETWFTKQ